MISSVGTFWLFFPTKQWKTAYLFGCSSHSVYFFVKKTFHSFPKKLSICAYFSSMQKECFSGHHTLLPRPYLSFSFPILLKLYILHQQAYCLTFVLWVPFFSCKEPKMVCLNSRRFVYVFKNQMHDSKTLECSNSSQRVVLLNSIEKDRRDQKKFELQRENHARDRQICSTYRDVRVFEYLSYRDFFCLKRVSRFKGPTNLFDLTRCSSFRVFELLRVNCMHNGQILHQKKQNIT